MGACFFCRDLQHAQATGRKRRAIQLIWQLRKTASAGRMDPGKRKGKKQGTKDRTDRLDGLAAGGAASAQRLWVSFTRL